MRHRTIAVGLILGVGLASGVGVAFAGVSDGNYRPERQHCSGNADATEREDTAEPGCQNFTVTVRDGNDHEAVRAGLPQLKNGEQPNPASATVEPSPEGFDPATGAHYYMGADDNLSGGEHDGTEQIGDGPSDGGSVVLNVDPDSITRWIDALTTSNWPYLLTHPLPLIDLGAGVCTDGLCYSAQSQRRTAYDGGSDTAPPRDAANYGSYEWDPEACSSADSTEADCGPGGIAYWHNKSGDAYVEPGVQVYEDPSPAGSPIGPFPLPAAYVGTCGVIAGGGPAQMPASDFTNDAGQVVIETGC